MFPEIYNYTTHEKIKYVPSSIGDISGDNESLRVEDNEFFLWPW